MTSLMRPVFILPGSYHSEDTPLYRWASIVLLPKASAKRQSWKNSTVINLCLMPCVGNKIARTAVQAPIFRMHLGPLGSRQVRRWSAIRKLASSGWNPGTDDERPTTPRRSQSGVYYGTSIITSGGPQQPPPEASHGHTSRSCCEASSTRRDL